MNTIQHFHLQFVLLFIFMFSNISLFNYRFVCHTLYQTMNYFHILDYFAFLFSICAKKLPCTCIASSSRLSLYEAGQCLSSPFCLISSMGRQDKDKGGGPRRKRTIEMFFIPLHISEDLTNFSVRKFSWFGTL